MRPFQGTILLCGLRGTRDGKLDVYRWMSALRDVLLFYLPNMSVLHVLELGQ